MTLNDYEVINITEKNRKTLVRLLGNLKCDMKNMTVTARESWLTTIWHYPLTKTYSNK